MIKTTFRKNGQDYPKQCRYCKYYRSGEQIITDAYSGITDSYDGYCSFEITAGPSLTLVNSGCHCYGFIPRGD